MNRTESFPWWRNNRWWLAGAIVLGAIAFAWPYREAFDHYQRTDPQRPIDVARGAWAEYDGARWRVVDAQWREADKEKAMKLPREDAAIVTVRYEIVVDKGVRARRFDACQGRLSDARGREWDANPQALSRLRSDYSRACGSRYDRENHDWISAPNGRPFQFEHVFLVPKSQSLRGLRPMIRMPKAEPTGSYLRFSL